MRGILDERERVFRVAKIENKTYYGHIPDTYHGSIVTTGLGLPNCLFFLEWSRAWVSSSVCVYSFSSARLKWRSNASWHSKQRCLVFFRSWNLKYGAYVFWCFLVRPIPRKSWLSTVSHVIALSPQSIVIPQRVSSSRTPRKVGLRRKVSFDPLKWCRVTRCWPFKVFFWFV